MADSVSSYSPDDHLRHFMYAEVARAISVWALKEFGRLPIPDWYSEESLPDVLDFGSKWFGDPDGGWRTHMRSMLKQLLGRDRFEHRLAVYDDGYDIETLANVPSASFDILIADQVLEHVARPWRAAATIARVVRPGGLVMISTPGLYPIHRSPLDCWRLLPDAYDVLFPPHLWETQVTYQGQRVGAWGTRQRLVFEYHANGGFPYGPPNTSVEGAMQQPHFKDEFDGRCPLILWFVGVRTMAAPRGDEW